MSSDRYAWLVQVTRIPPEPWETPWGSYICVPSLVRCIPSGSWARTGLGRQVHFLADRQLSPAQVPPASALPSLSEVLPLAHPKRGRQAAGTVPVDHAEGKLAQSVAVFCRRLRLPRPDCGPGAIVKQPLSGGSRTPRVTSENAALGVELWCPASPPARAVSPDKNALLGRM